MVDSSKKIKAWKEFGLFVISYFIIVGFFQYLAAVISGIDFYEEKIEPTEWQYLVITFFALVGTFIAVFLFIRLIDRKPFISLGFHYHGRSKDILVGFLAGISIIGIGYLSLLFFEQIKFLGTVFSIDQFLYTTVIFLMVAFMEEALFRGYVLGKFMRYMNDFRALIISSTFFALMHVMNLHADFLGLLNLFLAGILLGLPYVYTKNLWFPIALHFSWNLFQSLFGFNVSGQDSYSFIIIEIEEDNIFNGGDFGFEGSVLAIIMQLTVTILMFTLFEKKKKQKQKNLLIVQIS